MGEKNKRNYKLLISIIVTILVLAGSTYAAWKYLTEKTQIVMNVDGDRIHYDAGVELTVTDIYPVYSMEKGISKEIEIYKEAGRYDAGINLFMNLKTWPIQLSDASFRWALYKNGNYMTSGSFSGQKQGNTIKLTSNTQKINMEENKDTYKLYLWIDAYQESPSTMSGKAFTVSIYGQVSYFDGTEQVITQENEPNVPELAEGMIPIKYNYLIDEWQKADSTNANNDWYNYLEKYWANAVMVTSETRDKYMNADVDTTVLEDDILAYYVWIPRYRYVLFNVNSQIISAQEIQLEFQKTTDEVSNGTQNGEFLTHPAFWWDNNSDGERTSDEELSGFWFGKFELGGTNSKPLVKPELQSTMNSTGYVIFNSSKKMQTDNYLTNIGVNSSDVHMEKNIEWGAAVYLSQTKYGEKSICANSFSDHITGRSTKNYSYNDFYIDNSGEKTINKEPGKGSCASTTGNVSGIYDMSGGLYDAVLVFTKNSSGSVAVGNGFNASNMPESKYYDLYEYGTSTSDYSRRILGDATGETRGWTSGGVTMPTSSSLLGHGGYYNSNGLFSSYNSLGMGHSPSGSRSVIVIP